jgi:hypothetical protein
MLLPPEKQCEYVLYIFKRFSSFQQKLPEVGGVGDRVRDL